jgi:predicted SnoaL-like aldol condensation-catalyzing enzyme
MVFDLFNCTLVEQHGSQTQEMTSMNTPKNNKEMVDNFCTTVFVRHDLSTLGIYMRDDYIQHNPDVPQGKAGFRQFFEATFKAMPDFKYSLKQMVAEGDFVWMYCTTSGTHTGGEWLGVPPTGNKLNFDVVDMFRIQDGLIAEHWDVADTYSLFSQLGKIK